MIQKFHILLILTDVSSATKLPERHQLRDSIIHFGEKLRNGSPYNWETAKETLKNVDLIICFGSSLKVLKHYSCLWPKKKSVSLYIANIQYTPKDKFAKTKINGYCDDVFRIIIKHLQKTHFPTLKVENYSILNDPLFRIAVNLNEDEHETTTKKILLQNEPNMSVPKREKSMSSSSLEVKDGENEKKNTNGSGNSWFTKSFKAKKTNVKNKKN
jgi:NAD-dependent deacetylase sirtuin 7